jgi:hypothetical protein
MTEESKAIVEMVSNFGFPILLTIYLLFRFEKRMTSLEEKIDKLSIVDELREDVKAITTEGVAKND